MGKEKYEKNNDTNQTRIKLNNIIVQTYHINII